MKRSRFYIPLLVSATLFALYWILREEPVMLGRLAEMREQLFGKNLRWLLFAAIVPLTFVVVRFLDVVIWDVMVGRRRNVIAPQLLREIMAILLYFVLFAWAIAEIFNYRVTAALATGTILAAVIGLALQETLGNLFSGIALHLEDSFEVGDVIRSGEFIGVVESVRWRATRIRTFGNNIVLVPNSVLARERLDIYPRNHLNARVLTVGIDYNTAPAVVISVLTQAASRVDGVSHELPCIARVASFGDSSVVYEIKYFTRDYSTRDRIDADIRKAVWYALRRNGISIPFPIRSFQPYRAPQAEQHSVSSADVVQRLSEVEVLSPLSPPALETLAQAARVHYYSKGETILRLGAEGDSMFVIHSGSVSVLAPDGDEVAQLGPGAFFGEMALLTGEPRAAEVVAASDVIAFEIGREALQPILVDHPELAAAISSKVMQRRGTLAAAAAEDDEAQHRTVLSRIRDYFGL